MYNAYGSREFLHAIYTWVASQSAVCAFVGRVTYTTVPLAREIDAPMLPQPAVDDQRFLLPSRCPSGKK